MLTKNLIIINLIRKMKALVILSKSILKWELKMMLALLVINVVII